MDGRLSRVPAPAHSSSRRRERLLRDSRLRSLQQRRRFLFEALEDRRVMATWTGGGVDPTNWLADDNWGGAPGAAPDQPGETAVFDGAVAGSAINIGAGINIASVTFTGAASGFTITGAASTLGTITHSATGTNAINSVIMGTSSVAVNDGTFTLGSVLNTYTGTTAINKGTLSAADLSVTAGASSLGNAASAITLGNATDVGTLLYTGNTDTANRPIVLGTLAASATGNTINVANAAADLTLSGVISGGPANAVGNTALTITGAGRTLLTGGAANTFTGNVIVDASRLTITNETRLGNTPTGQFKSLTLQNGSTLAVTATTNPGSSTTSNDKRIIVGAGGGTVDVPSGVNLQLDDAGQFSGPGHLTKIGAGTLWLGQTTYTQSGGITLNAGIIRVNASSTVSGGVVTQGPIGTGPLTINGGTLQANDGNTRTLHNPVTVLADFTFGATGTNLTLDPSGVTGGVTTLDGPRTITVPSNTQRINGRIVGANSPSLTKVGGGDLYLNNNTGTANSFGNVAIDAGRLFLDGSSAANLQNTFGAGAYTIAGGASLVTADGRSITPTNSVTVQSNGNLSNRAGTITYAAATTTLPTQGILQVNRDDANTATINLQSPIALTGDLTIQAGGTSAANSGGNVTFNGVISGTGNLIKTGAGAARLAGLNTYDGTTQINTGALVFTNTSALPGGLANFNPSQITVESGAALGLTVGNAAGQFSPTLVDTVLAQMGPSTASTGLKPGSHIGLDTTAASFVYPTAIGDLSGGNSIGFSKLGTNTLTLDANFTTTSGTTVYSGTLQLGNGGTTGMVGAGTVNLLATSTLTFNRGDDIVVPNLINGSNLGAVIQIGAGDITFAGANNHTMRAFALNSVTTVDFGAGATTMNNGGGTTLSSNGGGTLNATGGTITFATDADNSTISGLLYVNAQIVGAIRFEACCDDGIVVLTNQNTYTLDTQINNGAKLSVEKIGLAGSAVNSNLGSGTRILLNQDNPRLIYTGTGESTNRIIDLQTNTAGTSFIEHAGTGLLQFTAPLSRSGAQVRTLHLTGSTSGIGEFTGAIINNSSTNTTPVIKSGTGTWILSGANTYTGATTVNGGLLLLNGAAAAASAIGVNSGGTLGGSGSVQGVTTVNAGGALDPGGAANAAGKFTSSAAITFSAGSSYNFQLGAATTPGVTYDQLTSSGSINLGGATLSGSLLSTFVPGTSSYDIITTTGSGVITGTFAGLGDGATLYIGGQKFAIQYVGGVGSATAVRLVDQNVSVSTSTVYVNNNWANTTLESDADGAGVLGAQFGVNAFADIQSAINALPAAGGTVVIQGNTSGTPYSAAINVNRPGVVFQFAADSVPGNAAETDVFISGNITLTEAPAFANAGGPLSGATSVTFSGTINGGVDLNFSGMTTPVSLNGVVGGTSPLTSLSSSVPLTINTSAITTTGSQTYNGSTTVGVAANLTADSVFTTGMTLNAALTTTVSGVTSNLTGLTGPSTLTKSGTGTLALSGSNNYAGTTTVNGGVLTIANDDALPTAGTLAVGGSGRPGTFDLAGFNQTIGSLLGAASNTTTASIITIAPTKTLTVTGNVTIGTAISGTNTVSNLVMNGGGIFRATGATSSFQVGGDNSTSNGNAALLDMTGLAEFSTNITTFRIGDATGNTGTGASTVLLAPTSMIVATTLSLDTGRSSVQTLRLGTGVNTLQANTINIGQVTNRASGVLNFVGPTGSLIVRDKAGTGRAAFNVAAGTTGTDGHITSVVDLRGHNADLLFSTFKVAERTGSGAGQLGSSIGTFSFDMGTLDASTIQLAYKTGTTASNSPVSATLNLGGGIVNVGSGGIVSARNDYTTGTGSAVSVINLSGGVVVTSVGDIKKFANTGTQTATSVLNIDNATIRAGSSSATFLQGMNALNILPGDFIFDSNGFTPTAAQPMSGTGDLTKIGAGTLTLTGNSGFTGLTTVANGTLTIGTNGNLPATSSIIVGSAGNTATLNVTSTGTVQLGASSVTLGTAGSGVGNYTQNGAAGNVSVPAGILDGGTSSVAVNSGTTNVAGGLTVDTLSVASVATGTLTGVLNVTSGAVSIGNGTGTLAVANTTSGVMKGTLNLSGASAVDINVADIRMAVLDSSGAGTNAAFVLSASGINNLTAATMLVGEAPNGGNDLQTSTVQLGGGANNLNINTVTLGGRKSNVTATILAGGTLNLKNQAGTGNANLIIGDNNAGTVAVVQSKLDLTGGTFNGQLGSVLLGRHGSGTGSGSGALIMDAGTVTATSLLLADPGASSSNAANSTGTLTVNGGSFTVNGTITDGGGTATINQNGGTVRFVTLDRTVTTFAYNFNAGTIQNPSGSDSTNVDVNINVNGAGPHSFLVDATRNLNFQAGAIVSGNGAYSKDGVGVLTLGGVNTNTGAVAVNAGTLVVNGSTDPASAITANAGGTIGGTGNIQGPVSTASGGVVDAGAVGAFAGTLQVANSLVLVGGSTFAAQLGGNTAGDGAGFYDQVTATGTVDLGGATLSMSLIGAFTPVLNTSSFTILNKTSAGPVTGTFLVGGDPLVEGEVFVSGGLNYQISYLGGDGNDVVVRPIDLASPALQGTPGVDTFLVRANGATTEVLFNGNLIYSGTPAALNLDGLAGNDVFNVDFSLGNGIPVGGLTIAGGAPTTAPGDVLNVTGNVGGTPFTSVEYDVTGIGAGILTFAGPAAVINFSGLEPATISSLAGTVIIDIDNGGVDGFGGPINTTISDNGAGTMLADFDVGAEDLVFVTPTVALTILGDNSGVDNITIASVPAGFAAALTIDGQGGIDSITNSAALALGSGTSTGVVALSAETINVNNSISTAAVTTGSITLTGGRLNLAGNLSTDGANITMAMTNVVLTATAMLDTEAGNNNNAGNVNLTGATVSASAAGLDLAINTNVAGAGFTGGNVTLGVFNGATPGTAFVNDLTVNATGSTPALSGTTTLTGSIALDNNGGDLGDFTILGTGDVAIAASLTVDTENNNDANPGNVNWTTSNVYALLNNSATLTINANSSVGSGTGAQINVGRIDDNAGANFFLAGLTATTQSSTSGEIQLAGDVLVDGPIDLMRRTVAMISLTIDSKQSATGPGNNITLGGAIYARGGVDRDIVLDASATAPGAAGGTVSLGSSGAGLGIPVGGTTFHPNDVTVITSAGPGGTAGSVRFGANVELNDAAPTDAASLTVIGGGNIVLLTSVSIDTESGNSAGITDTTGGVYFGTSPISATGAGFDFSINTSNTGAGAAGGNIVFGGFTNGGGQYVNDVTLTTNGPLANGSITLNGNVSLDANGPDGAVFTVAGGGNVLLNADVTIDIEQGNSAGVGVGSVNLGTSAISSLGSVRDLSMNTANTGTGSAGGDVTLAIVNAAGGFGVNDLTINTSGPTGGTFGNVNLNGAVSLVSNGGDAGDFAVTANAITQAAAAAIGLTGNVNWNALQAVTLNNSVATTGTGANGLVSILANQDGAGSEGLVMNAGSSISTSNDTAAAVSLTVNTATGTGNATLRGVSAGMTAGAAGGRITIAANSGAIVDGDNIAANVIAAGNLVLTAAAGIGSADALETAVRVLSAENTTSGDIQISNALTPGGLLTLANIAPVSAGFAVRNLGGALTITNASPLVVAANTSAVGAVLLSAGDSAAVGDDLTVNGGVLVESTGSSVTLNAGDEAIITGNVTAATTVTVNVDEGNADVGVGGAVTITGVVTTPAVGGGAFLTGDVDDDEFNFAPQATTAFDVNGDLPFGTPTGDTLNLDITGATAASLTLGGIGAGSWSFTPATLRSVVYTSIEDVNANGQYHLVLDASATSFGNTGIDDYLTLRRSGTDFVLERTGDLNLPNDAVGIVFTGDFATILSFTYLGSNDNDVLTISDVGGLVDFAGTVPGVTDNGNLTGTAEFLFDGRAGSDRLVFDLTGASAAQSYAIGTGTAAGLEGEVSSTSGGTTLISYFQDVDLAQRTGIGATPGSLTIIGDANANGFTTAANGALTRTSATGYTPFEFSGNNFTEITINALGGADSLDLESLGTGQTNSPAITLDGGDGNDTIRAQSTSGNTGDLDLIGGTGNDVFELYSNANTVDGLAGPVDVDGTDGNAGGNLDRLVIIDSGDGSGDNVLIEAVDAATSEDYVITGLGPVTSNVTFRSIDDLQYTGTAGNDTIDAQFVATTPLHDLNTVILAGFNGADQFLLFTSDQLGGTSPTPTPAPSGLSSITLLGGDGLDTFGATPTGLTDTGAMNVGLVVPDSTRMIRPSLSTAIIIDGGPPSVAMPTGDTIGDVLNLDISDLPDTLPVVVASGTVNIPGAPLAFAPLTWTDIEDLNLVDDGVLTNVQVGDLFGRMTDANDLVQFSRLNGVNQVRMRVNNWSGVYTVPGKTIVYGRGGIDHITQANLFNPAVFYGEDGNDVLTGASNNDWLVGGAGNDRISGAEGTNVLWGDDAPTSAVPEPQDVDGDNDGDDNLSAGLGNDVFYGGGGNDLVNAGGGNDYVHGGWGNDNLAGVAGDDRLYGGEGDDVLSGYLGNDLLSGGAGNDRLYGQTGNDVIIGGDGEDMLVGDTGNDLLITGIVANEHSTWSSLAPTSTFSAATYSDPGDNDTALLNLLLQWGSASNSSLLGSITHDGDDDDVAGYTGADDFCWEAADLLDQPGATTPSDFNAPSMGPDERFGPTF
jgi:fibronectin-binding autotransporter adhesin